MKGFVQGADRQQTTLLPECLDDWVDESNPVRAVDVFVDALELRDLGFDGVDPTSTGRPGYHPSAMLKLYIFGYLNRVQSSRRLETVSWPRSMVRGGPSIVRWISKRRLRKSVCHCALASMRGKLKSGTRISAASQFTRQHASWPFLTRAKFWFRE